MLSNSVLLTPAEHQIVLLNVKVNLTWHNVNGTFIGPYVSSADYDKFIKGAK